MQNDRYSSKERVLAAFAHQEPDRVPVNYKSNPGIDQRLKQHYGLAPDDHRGLKRALGVDFAGVNPPYRGPNEHEAPPDRRVDLWGVHTRYIEHDSGGYWDFCDFPLREATPEQAQAWPMPDPDFYDYDAVRRAAENNADFCVHAGAAGLGCIINRVGKLRSMDQILIDLLTDDPVANILIRRMQDIQLATMERCLDACRGSVDFLYMGEDLSTQRGAMISLDLYRSRIRPWHQRFVDLAKSHGLPVMFHSCGACSWAFEDFIDMGIDVVETLQPEAANMTPKYLKEIYGDRLSFHGCIPTGGVMAEGTPEEVAETCRDILEVMMPGGGYCFAPSHQLQDNTPTENAVAMYDTAREHGVYR